MSIRESVNNWIHTPVGAFLTYHAWWAFMALVKFPVSFCFLGLSFLYEGFMMMFGNRVVSPNVRASKLVVISGCDTGFGRELAILLSQKSGYTVLAGCLKDESQSTLAHAGGDNLHTAALDVTDDTSVESFTKVMNALLAKGGPNMILHAVVNNAGIGNLMFVSKVTTRSIL